MVATTALSAAPAAAVAAALVLGLALATARRFLKRSTSAVSVVRHGSRPASASVCQVSTACRNAEPCRTRRRPPRRGRSSAARRGPVAPRCPLFLEARVLPRQVSPTAVRRGRARETTAPARDDRKADSSRRRRRYGSRSRARAHPDFARGDLRAHRRECGRGRTRYQGGPAGLRACSRGVAGRDRDARVARQRPRDRRPSGTEHLEAPRRRIGLRVSHPLSFQRRRWRGLVRRAAAVHGRRDARGVASSQPALAQSTAQRAAQRSATGPRDPQVRGFAGRPTLARAMALPVSDVLAVGRRVRDRDSSSGRAANVSKTEPRRGRPRSRHACGTGPGPDLKRGPSGPVAAFSVRRFEIRLTGGARGRGRGAAQALACRLPSSSLRPSSHPRSLWTIRVWGHSPITAPRPGHRRHNESRCRRR